MGYTIGGMQEYIIAAIVGCIIGCIIMFFALKKTSTETKKTTETEIKPEPTRVTYDQINQVDSRMETKGYRKQCRSKCADPLKKCPKGCTCCAQEEFDKQAKEIEDEINAILFGAEPSTKAEPKPAETEKKKSGNFVTSTLGSASKTLTTQFTSNLPSLPSII